MLFRASGKQIIYLSSKILQEFIDIIVVHHREEIMREIIQEVEIYYRMIGHIEIPKMSKLERESCIKNFGRKKEEQIA